jgi:GntR family transcriptional regulator
VGERLDDPVLYRRVAAELKRAILGGGYDDGSRLPSEHELAEQYGVSRGTVRQAFAVLREAGLLASRQGARRVVVGSQVQNFNELRSFSAWASGVGAVPGARVVSFRQRPATAAEIRELDLTPGADVWVMTRVRLLAGRPVMIERTAFPERVGRLLVAADAAAGSVTAALEERGVRFERAEHVLSAMAATAEDARLLGVTARHPLLRALRRTTDPAGVPVEWSDDRYLGEAMAFSVHNSVSANSLSRRPQ